MTITATYSAEDNKLRLYSSSRLDRETYDRVKAAGFKWAPKQDLFVAPMWTPAREDLAIELAGEIEAEESTMAERAEAKADRLEELAGKRRREANAFSRAAHAIAERFSGGQPILVGHHSERSARRDHARADNLQRKAVEADKAAGWWLYKATAAQHNANRKNSDGVRARRIKTLLAELRDLQRKLNHARACIKLLESVPETDDAHLEHLGGSHLKEGAIMRWDAYSHVRDGRSTWAQERQKAIELHANTIGSDHLRRWIEHTLNRLSFERELLGEVQRWDGDVTPVMLQEFSREHGAQSPKGDDNGDGTLTLSSTVTLPLHIANGESVALTADQWRDLMHSCGYEVAAKAAAKASSKAATMPLLNISPETAATLQCANIYYRGQVETYQVVPMTKEEYSKIHAERRGTRVSLCKRFRFRIGPDPTATGPRYMAPWVAVYLTDSKAHQLPAAAIAEATRR